MLNGSSLFNFTKRCFVAIAFVNLFLGTLIAAPGDAKFVGISGHKANANQVIARYKSGEVAASSQNRAELLSDLDASEIRSSSLVSGLVVLELNERPTVASNEKRDPADALLARIKELKASGRFEYVEPNWVVQAMAVPTDGAFSDGRLWGLRNSGQSGGLSGADVNAEAAWNITTGSESVVVGVIDSGVRYTHWDLEDNMWTNPGEIPNDGIDNDRNGYVDDVYGINAYSGTGDPMDDNDHGTHCAGTIGAMGNGGGDHVGVAWNVQIMALKFLGADGSGSTDGAIECIEYAIENGVDILSNSWGGGGYSRGLADAIQAANNAGIIFIAAAGNESNNNDWSASYPASYEIPNVISVAALDRADELASFSNYGFRSVDIGAPGVSIYSTVAGNDFAYDYLSGTSMATPHVSGVAALLKSQYPNISVSEMRLRLLNTARPVSALNGVTTTGGAVDAYAALNAQADGVLELRVQSEETPLRAGESTRFFLAVSDLSAVSGASVIGRFNEGSSVTFWDTGLGADAAANDGVYSASLVVPDDGPVATLTVNVVAVGKTPASESFLFDVLVPPVNDDFADRVVLSGSAMRSFGNNLTATSELNEPNNPSTSGRHSVWWEWAPAGVGNASISTSGSDFDTTLAVYTGDSLEGLSLVASNDDADGLQSVVTFEAEAGASYKVQVNGYGDAVGSIVLNYPPAASVSGAPVVVRSPTGQAVLVGEPIVLDVAANGAAPLTYQWFKDDQKIEGATQDEYMIAAAIPEDRGHYYVEVSNSISSVLSSAAYVAVDRVGVAKENDRFVQSEVLPGNSGRITGVANSLAGGETGEPNHADNSLPLNSLWWSWTATQSGTLILDTYGSNFDTTLAVYSGAQVDSLVEVASNDDSEDSLQSRLLAEVVAGRTYRIAVDGYATRSGNIVLDYLYSTNDGRPLNDDFEERIQIELEDGFGLVTGANIDGTGESEEPVHGDIASPLSSVWWYFEAPESGKVRVSTAGSDFDTVLAVYRGVALAGLSEVGSNDDTAESRQSRLEFPVAEGEVYSIAVDGYDSAEGRVTLQVELEESIALVDALDRPGLDWKSEGNDLWFTQTEIASDSVDAAQSGQIGNDESSTLQVKVSGPSQVSFWWRADSEEDYDILSFEIDGELYSNISGATEWSEVEVNLGEGEHILSWTYSKDWSFSYGADAGWVDRFSITYERDFAFWANLYFPSNSDPEIISAAGDPDWDGSSNLLEYFLGTLPNDPASKRSISVHEVIEPGGPIVVRYLRNSNAPDVVGIPLWSIDLVNWHQSGDDFEGLSVEFERRVFDTSDPDFDLIELRATPSEDFPETLFLRVELLQF